jgi:hypothetical protein
MADNIEPRVNSGLTTDYHDMADTSIAANAINADIDNNRNSISTQIEGMDTVHRDELAKQRSDSDDDDMTKEEKLMKQEEESFYSASENTHGDDNIWGLLSGVGGNIYEWYVLPMVYSQVNHDVMFRSGAKCVLAVRV